MSQTNLVSSIYNPANQSEKELVDGFIVRLKEFESIFGEMKKSDMKYPEQHFIIQGPRGSGKTTLLLRLLSEIKNDEELNKWLIPIRFNEEQYNIRTLHKLWEEIALRLERHDGFSGLYDEMQKYWNNEDYELKCYEVLKNALKENKKKIILMIDNFGDMLKKFQEREHQRLREVLITSSDIRIIGASSVVLEFTYDYSKPFFEFFNIIHLEGLSHEDTVNLLLKLSEKYKQDEVGKIVVNNPGRVEALRRLTGGVPRTIVLLFEIFADSSNGDTFKDLEGILDRVTPLYKHRMDDLSSQQQEITDAIAMNWDAISTKEIAQKTRMDSKAVSSHLNLLEKNRIIIKIATDTKNHLYQISERFFNIWYLMRYGKERDRNRVLWLTQFLESWCDKDELVSRTNKHIVSLKSGRLYGKYALYMTEALARTGISEDLQDNLLKSTREYIGEIDKELLVQLSKSDRELLEEAAKDYMEKNYKLSLKKTMLIVNKNDLANFFIAFLYQKIEKDNKNAEKYYRLAAEQGNSYASLSLAVLYQYEYNEYKKAEKYYQLAVEQGNADAMSNLAWLYFVQKKNKVKALDLARRSFENGENDIFISLTFSLILLWNNETEEAVKLSKELLEKQESFEKFNNYVTTFSILLIAKKQYNSALKLFKESKFNLLDKYKPIYYALMYFMQDDNPNEYKKMGEELKETVAEVVEEIKQMAVDYA